MKTRLSRLEPCQPNCVSTSTLHLRLAGDTLAFEAEVHAADSGAWPLPGPPASWTPSAVSVDGQATGALARLDDGSSTSASRRVSIACASPDPCPPRTR